MRATSAWSRLTAGGLVAGTLALAPAAAALAAPPVVPVQPAPAVRAEPAPPPPRPAPDGIDARRQAHKLTPSQFAVVVKPRKLIGSTRRHIVLRPGKVDLMVGPSVTWSGPLSVVGGEPGLADVGRVVAHSPHPDWLSEVAPGIWMLRAALVQAPGTSLDVSTPRVRELRMLSDSEVYLAGVSATVHFVGVRVTSWRPAGGPDPVASLRRPFISYDRSGSVIEATRSQFTHLGGDGTLAYGVSWGRGATGSANQSTFDHNYFGAYTNAAIRVVFRGNAFHHNALYGLDPHTGSRRIIVDRNEAYRNGTHGIIFSEDVIDGSITNNRSYENRANGIMLDERSDHNMVSGNQTWGNGGDGIVVQNSSRAIVRGNTVTSNRVGIRVGGTSLSNTISDNQLLGNKRGLEAYAGPPAVVAIAKPTVLNANRITGTGQADGITVKNVSGLRITANIIRRYINGILVTGSSRQVAISANRLSENQRGIFIDSPAMAARLDHNVVEDATERGIVLAGPGALSLHDSVVGSDIGVDIRSSSTVQQVDIDGVRRGIDVSGGRTRVEGAEIKAREIGLAVDAGALLYLRQSQINARQPISGAVISGVAGNSLLRPPAPFRWLALAGAIFIVLAVCLNLLHRARSPICYAPTKSTPRGVRNAW